MKRIKPKSIIHTMLLPIYFALCGCASYHAVPLVETTVPLTINALVDQVKTSGILTPNAVSLQNGLDLDELANLALFNSPLLKVNQQQYLVNQANAKNLGIYPDPQLSASFDHPSSNVLNAVNAWTGGIGYDLNALVTHQRFIELGIQQIKQAKLTLLWQAWQIKLQAKLLGVDLYYTEQKISAVKHMIATLEQRYQQSKMGITEGNVTLETNGADLSILLDTYSQLKTLQQQYNGTSHQLAQLLGVKSLVGLTITPLSSSNEISKDNLSDDLMNISKKRPDLLALQAGYHAQEESVRAAILAQFPSINLGISTAKDTGALYTKGLNIGITLPLFDGNKGNILITRATRKKLAEEYQLRLIQTRSEVDELWQLYELLNEQQRQLAKHLPTLQTLVVSAKKAYGNGDIAALPFIAMESTWFNKQLEQLDLQQNKWRTQLSLSLLLMKNNVVEDLFLDEKKPID